MTVRDGDVGTTALRRVRYAFTKELRSLGLPAPRTLLLMLVTADAALIMAHLAQKLTGRPGAWYYDLGADHSWNELYLYLKWIWIAGLAVVLWHRERAPVFLAAAAICAVLFIEDSMMLHERMGWYLEPWLTANVDALDGRMLVAFQVGELL